VVALVAVVARERWPLVGDDRAELLHRAGDWYAANDRPREAIDAYWRSGRTASGTDLLRKHGPSWVNAGGAATIAAAIESFPTGERDPQIRLLFSFSEALLVLGEDDRALAELTALAEATASAGDGCDLPAGLAWRLGAAHYQRGDPQAASAAFARGRVGDQAPADAAMLLAGSATARWMAGGAPA
jgi:ATP/maltotriose-dependent transcriptional regulator MalT